MESLLRSAKLDEGPGGGSLTQIKTDGIGFQMIMPHELPQAIRVQSEEIASIKQTQNSTDLDFQHNNEGDPLLEFLKKRKQLRLQFEHRYSRKAIGITAYLKQKDSPYSPKMYNGILVNYQPD